MDYADFIALMEFNACAGRWAVAAATTDAQMDMWHTGRLRSTRFIGTSAHTQRLRSSWGVIALTSEDDDDDLGLPKRQQLQVAKSSTTYIHFNNNVSNNCKNANMFICHSSEYIQQIAEE